MHFHRDCLQRGLSQSHFRMFGTEPQSERRDILFRGSELLNETGQNGIGITLLNGKAELFFRQGFQFANPFFQSNPLGVVGSSRLHSRIRGVLPGIEGGQLATEFEQIALDGEQLGWGELADSQALLLVGELFFDEVDLFLEQTPLFLARGG